jgi:ABC-type multidrug transport system fused ATPase/permease subunit
MIKKILFLLNKNETRFLLIISVFTLLGIFLEMLSFAIIIPVFNVIFLNNFIESSFFQIFFSYKDFIITKNSKIIFLILLISVFFIKNIYLIILNYYNKKFFYFLNIRVSSDLFSLYLRQNYFFFLNSKSDNLLRKSTNDISGFQTFLSSFQALITELIFIFFLSLLLFSANYFIFLFCAFIFTLISIIYIKIIRKRIKLWGTSYQANFGYLQNLISEGVKGIKDIFVYSLEKFFSKKFYYFTKTAQISFFKVDFINNVQRFWMEILAVFSMTTPIIILLLFDVNINELIPIFVLFSVSIFRIVPSFNRIIQNYQNIKFFTPSVDLIYKEFSELSVNNNTLISNNFEFKDTIEFKSVSLSYNKDSLPILTDVNIKILKGESVLILGDNGSGKSTLLNILSGLLEPSSGKILIDNEHDIYKNKKVWLNKLSYVQQNIFLINTTIKKNILLEQELLSDNSKFMNICNLLSLDKVFSNLPQKLDTVVGNDGLYLSGGQKQLISIARALYKNSEIVVFDEANSALDKDYTNILKNLIISLKGRKTLIMVTHELSFLKDSFDKIYRIQSRNLILEKDKS